MGRVLRELNYKRVSGLPRGKRGGEGEGEEERELIRVAF